MSSSSTRTTCSCEDRFELHILRQALGTSWGHICQGEAQEPTTIKNTIYQLMVSLHTRVQYFCILRDTYRTVDLI
jgi:hypothetical protein